MATVTVPKSVSLGGLNQARPQERDRKDDRQDDRQDDQADRQDVDRRQALDRRQDDQDRQARNRRQDDRRQDDRDDQDAGRDDRGDDGRQALDRQDDRPTVRVVRQGPDTINALDPAHFPPPPPVDRQQGPDSLDALGGVDQDPASSRPDSTEPRPDAPNALDALDGRQALDDDDLDVGRRLYRQVRQARVDTPDGQALDDDRQGPDTLDTPDGQAPDDHQALDDHGLDPLARRRRLTPRQRAAIYDLENPQPELHPWARVKDLQARQALDPDPPARRPTRMTPQRRAALYDLAHPQPAPPPPSPEVNDKAAMLMQGLDDNRRNRRNRPVELTPRYERLVEKLMARRQARRQATAGVRNVGMRDSQPYRLPKVVVYNDSSGPRAPRSPR